MVRMSFIDDFKSDISKIIGRNICIKTNPYLGSYLNKTADKDPQELTIDFLRYNKESYQSVHFSIIAPPTGDDRSREVAKFALQQMPGCCGLLVSTGSFVNVRYRNKGIGHRLNQFRQQLAHQLGYSALICTDVHSNDPQRKILKKNGFQDIYQFTNARTGNVLDISVCQIYKP